MRHFPLLILLFVPLLLFAQKSTRSNKPILDPIPAQSCFPGDELVIQLSGRNQNGDNDFWFEFAWAKGGRIDQETNTFYWMPTDADLGSHPIIFTAIDTLTNDQVSQPAIITVKPIQYRPEIMFSSNRILGGRLLELTEGEDFALVIEASDSNLNERLKLDYFIDNQTGKKLKDARFEVNDRLATFLWTPSDKDAKKKNVSLSFRVQDESGQRDEKTIFVFVQDVDHSPVFVHQTKEYVFSENKASSFKIEAKDEDGDEITYGLQTSSIRESDYFFDSGNGKFQWKPSFQYASKQTAYDLIFSASDGQSIVYDTIRINVSAINYPPEFAAIRDKNIRENETLTLKIQLSDRNGDEGLRLELLDDDGISGYTFDPEKRNFSWKPPFTLISEKGSKRTYEIRFRATDGIERAEQSVKITVSDRDDPQETLRTYQENLGSAQNMLAQLTQLETDLGQTIKRKQSWNTIFDVATITVGVFTGIASSSIASEGLREASVPIGAAATSLIGVRNITNKSLDKITNLKTRTVALISKIQVTLNTLNRKYGEEPGPAITERNDFKADLTDLIKEVENFEKEKVEIQAFVADLALKKKKKNK
ncbi:MAG: hypothetical protein AAF206_18780 [Bacteroidota bacterium]